MIDRKQRLLAKESGYQLRSPCQAPTRCEGLDQRETFERSYVAFPDDIDPVKDSHEESALRKDTGSNEGVESLPEIPVDAVLQQVSNPAQRCRGK